MIINNSDIIISRHISGISESERTRIYDYLQGLVYCWCKEHGTDWFAARNLVGGENYYWEGTPIQILYQKHVDNGDNWETAVSSAAKDLGWLLLNVINNDKRHFTTRKEFTREYSWDGDSSY